MALLQPRTLTQALWLLLAAVVAPLLFGTLVLLVVQTEQDGRVARSRLAAVTQTLVQAVDAEFERGRAQLEVLAASPFVDTQEWERLRSHAAEVTRAIPGSLVVLVGPTGQVLFNTSARPGDPLPNLWALGAQNKEVVWEGRSLPLSSGNLSKDAYESGKAVYSNLYYGVQVRRPALSLSIPVLRQGAARYALIFSYSPQFVQERIRTSVNVPNVRAVLVDRNGRVVASNDASVTRTGDSISAMDAEAGATGGYYRARGKDGTLLRGAYAVSPISGFMVRVGEPDPGLLLPSRLTSLAWIALVVAALVTSMVLAGLLGRRLARPLRELGDDVRAGRAPSPRPPTGIAEIDLLTQALREGARAEQDRADEQTRRQLAEHERALLRRADRQKDEFLATLAHELRNPLAPIRTATELLRVRLPPADGVAERARSIIERQVLHLARLVDDLLDVSRITLGRIQLRRESVDLAEIAAAASEAVAEAAAQRGVRVARELQPGVRVHGDPTRLTQCVMNLLNNAVKFTPAGGRVLVRVRRAEETAVIEVEDTGVGIAADHLESIFELFVQERHSGREGNSGLGIGLALTRRLLQLHGGTVHARSAGHGEGSTFCIELPVVHGTEPANATQEQAATAGAPRAAPSTQVLVVDDNLDAAETTAELLLLSGYEVAQVHDGRSALQFVAQRRPAVVLLDVGLPDIDGYETCRLIRAGDHQPLVIAVTGWGQQSDRTTAETAGFDGHLTKPVGPTELLAAIASGLQARGEARKL